MKIAAVILAAGHGKRMLSQLPKVLHPLARRPMILYSIESAAAVTTETPVVVIGHGAEVVRAAVGDRGRFAVQAEQLGTAHALQSARPLVEGQCDLVLVITADMPLIKTETMQQIIAAQRENSGPITMLTVEYDDPRGFGRVLRDPSGNVLAVVEEAQATPEQLEIRELNASVYCFRSDWLWPALEQIEKSPKGEYYLTDIVEVAARQGLPVRAIRSTDPDETIGINNRAYLAEAEAILRRRINRHWMDAGVTLVDPETTYIEPEVTIGQDTVIYPNTHLRGRTAIGSNCEIGPNVVLTDTKIGNSCTILVSVIEAAILEDEVRVGPFAHVAGGSHAGADSADARNLTIVIGTGAEIGSHTRLLAPVTVGAGAKTGAGAVVLEDVPPNSTVSGDTSHRPRTGRGAAPLSQQDKGER